MIRRPPRSTQSRSSAASDVYKRQAVVLALAEWLGKRNRSLEKMTWLDALFVGIAQVIAIFPGASRSGMTIGAGMARGLDRPSAARFAFLMSVPVMLAAGGYQSLDLLNMSGLGSFPVSYTHLTLPT